MSEEYRGDLIEGLDKLTVETLRAAERNLIEHAYPHDIELFLSQEAEDDMERDRR